MLACFQKETREQKNQSTPIVAAPHRDSYAPQPRNHGANRRIMQNISFSSAALEREVLLPLVSKRQLTE
jgi:hypothetical protein